MTAGIAELHTGCRERTPDGSGALGTTAQEVVGAHGLQGELRTIFSGTILHDAARYRTIPHDTARGGRHEGPGMRGDVRPGLSCGPHWQRLCSLCSRRAAGGEAQLQLAGQARQVHEKFFQASHTRHLPPCFARDRQ